MTLQKGESGEINQWGREEQNTRAEIHKLHCYCSGELSNVAVFEVLNEIENAMLKSDNLYTTQ